MSSPTQRTLAYLRENHFEAHIVEKFNSFSRRRVDLFGFGDVLAIREGNMGCLAVQTTSGGNVSARFHKVLEEPRVRTNLSLWLNTGNRFVIHGWAKKGKKGKRKTWQLREIYVTPDDLRDAIMPPLARRGALHDLSGGPTDVLPPED